DDTVDQPLHVSEFEGESVTLDCKYTTASPSQELFWYIQRTDESPKLVLQRNSYGGGINGTEFQERFYSEVKPSKSVPLIIQRLRVPDSALYYCALRCIS
uniref:T-cell receptor alpha/delta variable 31.0 n=1 Tax=Sinocyclocheilus grahami TaxID=75366 RepID=A0A672Q1C7_SINGR